MLTGASCRFLGSPATIGGSAGLAAFLAFAVYAVPTQDIRARLDVLFAAGLDLPLFFGVACGICGFVACILAGMRALEAVRGAAVAGIGVVIVIATKGYHWYLWRYDFDLSWWELATRAVFPLVVAAFMIGLSRFLRARSLTGK